MSTLSIASFDQFKNEDGSYSISVEKFREIIRGGGKMKRPMSAYFLWLNKERASIRTTYFDDYKTVENWDSETLHKYFENKGLGEPKKEGKPRIVSLVTMKAGKMWKEMTVQDKKPFVEQAEKLKEEYQNFKNMEADYMNSDKGMGETQNGENGDNGNGDNGNGDNEDNGNGNGDNEDNGNGNGDNGNEDNGNEDNGNGDNEDNGNGDNEMEVVEYKYKGVVYYYDEEKGDIYDIETGDKVAKMIDDQFTPIED
jgi:hypothetical protein